MLIRKHREDRGISQEQLAEAAGLSLRTIQRVEAGHRVSYASLRALAATFEINVDLLEQELYAMNNTKDDYIERPLCIMGEAYSGATIIRPFGSLRPDTT
ncbi:helix-turn-helix domain-containing protein [Cellvibrio sp.]|uniref:helix-turn-helix domain-containing protein n=1 Tax=Cellvibrio sp. TaxID=1965322 RepID=UPI003F4C06B0